MSFFKNLFKGTAPTFFSGGMSAISRWRDRRQEERQADSNLQYQRDNLAWQKQVQEQTWLREDNAIQRRVDDLKKAGLSPTLAAGSAAGAGAQVMTQAPQRGMQYKDSPGERIGQALSNVLNMQNMAMSILKQKADITKTESETEKNVLQNEYAKNHDLPPGTPVPKLINYGKHITAVEDYLNKKKNIRKTEGNSPAIQAEDNLINKVKDFYINEILKGFEEVKKNPEKYHYSVPRR